MVTRQRVLFGDLRIKPLDESKTDCIFVALIFLSQTELTGSKLSQGKFRISTYADRTCLETKIF